MLSTGELEQVRDAIGHRPWHALTADDLATAAGVSRMTLHRRGIRKPDIARGLGSLLEAQYAQAALPALSSTAPGPERLGLALRGQCAIDERFLGVFDGLAEVMAEVFHEDGSGEVLTRATFTGALHRILLDGEAEDTLTAGPDPEERATLLFNAAGWTYRHMRTGHRWPADKAAEQVTGLLVAGVSQ